MEDQYPDSYPRCRCCGWTSNTYESSLSEHASIFVTICRCRLVLSRASRNEPTSHLLKSSYCSCIIYWVFTFLLQIPKVIPESDYTSRALPVHSVWAGFLLVSKHVLNNRGRWLFLLVVVVSSHHLNHDISIIIYRNKILIQACESLYFLNNNTILWDITTPLSLSMYMR